MKRMLKTLKPGSSKTHNQNKEKTSSDQQQQPVNSEESTNKDNSKPIESKEKVEETIESTTETK